MNLVWCGGQPSVDTADPGKERLDGYLVDFFERLRKEPGDEDVYARLSDGRLQLLSEDEVAAPARIRVYCVPFWYEIAFQIPDDQSPWPDAYLCVSAQDADQASAIVADAIKRCGAWPKSTARES